MVTPQSRSNTWKLLHAHTPYTLCVLPHPRHHECSQQRRSIVLAPTTLWVNRQARVALGDRIRNSLQLTALRLKPSRLLGVQAPTLHYP
jgi:hypothetical protein